MCEGSNAGGYLPYSYSIRDYRPNPKASNHYTTIARMNFITKDLYHAVTL